MHNLNLSLFWFFNNFAGRSPAGDFLIVFLAHYLPYLAAALFLAVVIAGKTSRRTKVRIICAAALAVVLGFLVVREIRFFYHHLRPFAALAGMRQLIPESGYSFPSDHATVFFAISAVAYCFNKKFGVGFAVLSLIIGLARVAAGVHWPYDIFGGALLGALIGWLSVILVRHLFLNKSASSTIESASLSE